MTVLLTGVLLFQAPALVPSSVLATPGLPPVVILDSPTPEISALRLGLGYDPQQGYASELATHITRRRLESGAPFVGATVRVERTPYTVAINVAAADEDLDFLGSLLRRAVEPPTRGEIAQAVDAVRREREEAGETGLAYLRAAAMPRCETPQPEASGTRTTIVAASDEPPEVILAALGALAPSALIAELAAEPPPRVPDRGPPNTLRVWSGVWWTSPVSGSPSLSVLTRLLEGRADMLEAACATSILAWSASYPARLGQPEPSTPPDRALERARERLTDRDVRAAVDRTRLAVRRAASTPHQLVQLVGRHMDRTGQPNTAAQWLARLAALRPDDVRRTLDAFQREPSRRAGT